MKETTRVLIFDDFSPEGKGTGEFLRLVSKGISKDLNVKFGNVTVPHLSLVIVVNNLTAKQFIEDYPSFSRFLSIFRTALRNYNEWNPTRQSTFTSSRHQREGLNFLWSISDKIR